ncbi:MAG: sialate O-acetylesterase [Liquorilactobacillus hordei]|uniref:sialate O-acetylesterase n=1 Tax=Liquorilactobacillus hordei TaxID=468911 RepID=UPI0039EBF418
MGQIFADYFSDNMVLPANKEIRFGGTVKPYTKVLLSLEKVTIETSADSRGEWSIEFPAHAASKKAISIIGKSGGFSQIINNVHFGRVFLFAGQSNIEFKLEDEQHFENEKKIYQNDSVYFFNVPQIEFFDKKRNKKRPTDLKKGQWLLATRDNIGGMSAIAFYASKVLARDYEGPIGIVDCYKGGTSASCWLPLNLLKDSKVLNDHFIKPFEDAILNKTNADFDQEDLNYEKKVKNHQNSLREYQKKYPEKTLNEVKDVVGHTPWPPPMRPESYLRPGGLFETMILQIKYGTFNNVVWYQGENDTENADYYEELLSNLINTWRELFRDKSLPFLLIQLPGYEDGIDNTWAKIRQVQLRATMKIPYVKLCSISDLGESHNIHPTDKKTPGIRIGNILQENQYAETPGITKMCYEANRLTIIVSHALTLSFKNNTQFVVKTKGNKVESLFSANNFAGNKIEIDLPQGVASVEYGFINFPNLGIFNEFGLPLSPFRIVIEKEKARLSK